MKILAIETSCDDTCVTIIKALGKKRVRFKILSNIISSQIKIHRKWGGVYPSLAKREHQRNLVPVLTESLRKARLLKSKFKDKNSKMPTVHTQKIKIQNLNKILKREPVLGKRLEKFLEKYQKPKINLIAVTIGPGLEPCLWVGVNFAKALAFYWELPVVPINHIEAHILASFITRPDLVIQFPAICLVVSGGHTQLILMRNYSEYKILGETRDDAAGECFDKVARILGLGYPGGPAIAAVAAKFKIKNLKLKIKLPRPMIYQKNFDFSFSGLKTAVLYDYQNRPPHVRKSKDYIQEISAEVQQAIIDVLISKTIRAAKEYKAKSIILGGGVSANQKLRKQFKKKIKEEIPDTKYLIPDTKFCTDNAVMVAVTGYFRWLKEGAKAWTPTRPPPSRRVRAPEIEAEANIKIC